MPLAEKEKWKTNLKFVFQIQYENGKRRRKFKSVLYGYRKMTEKKHKVNSNFVFPDRRGTLENEKRKSDVVFMKIKSRILEMGLPF